MAAPATSHARAKLHALTLHDHDSAAVPERQPVESPTWTQIVELASAMARAMVQHADDDTVVLDLPRRAAALRRAGRAAEPALLAEAGTERWDLARLERAYILQVLEATGGHQSRAAQWLGIDRRTLYRKLREYGKDGV
jgi:DNA-binding NtrC family response regulator